MTAKMEPVKKAPPEPIHRKVTSEIASWIALQAQRVAPNCQGVVIAVMPQ
jgi:hypothetical protein